MVPAKEHPVASKRTILNKNSRKTYNTQLKEQVHLWLEDLNYWSLESAFLKKRMEHILASKRKTSDKNLLEQFLQIIEISIPHLKEQLEKVRITLLSNKLGNDQLTSQVIRDAKKIGRNHLELKRNYRSLKIKILDRLNQSHKFVIF